MRTKSSAAALLSRRRLLAVTAGGFLAQAQSRLTARQVIERIQKELGVTFAANTVDTFKAGDPDTEVKGIATTMMATFDVVKRAAAAGKNLVITHEPTFYNHEDATKDFAGNAVFEAKESFIEKNSMVIWRFHDYWHRRRPDGILTGMVEGLGWEKYRDSSNPRVFVLPGTTLEDAAREIQQRLKIRTMRLVGDPKLQVARFALSPGYSNLQGAVRALSQPDVDVLIVGEPREWEGVEYTQDAIAAGQKKALIILGHVVSEEDGMKECARWLKTFISEVPIEFIPAGEPFWTPGPKSVGLFDGNSDVGTLLTAGSVNFDEAVQTYTISASGDNMWAAEDDFHYVWSESPAT